MDIFISWSGPRSKAVAEILRKWIRSVMQATSPFVSSEDLERGAIWFGQIFGRLDVAKFGILCITPENQKKEWILFEAGALAKGKLENRVCPLVIGMKSTDLSGPLAQFNAATADEKGIKELFATMNAQLGTSALSAEDFESTFTQWWPKYSQELEQVIADAPDDLQDPKRPQEELLSEILDHVRSLSSRINGIEAWVWSEQDKQTVRENVDVALKFILDRHGLQLPLSELRIHLASMGYDREVISRVERAYARRQGNANLREQVTIRARPILRPRATSTTPPPDETISE